MGTATLRRAARVFAGCVLGVGAVLVAAAPAHASLSGFPGSQSSTAWTDFDGDGKADYCTTKSGNWLQCDMSNGTGFQYSAVRSSSDPGWSYGESWTDFNGDHKADYCRVIGSGYTYLQCTLSDGGAFKTVLTSGSVDAGYDAGRAWADFNGDGKADYCRVVGSWDKKVQCTLSAGNGWGDTFTSGALDPGYDPGRAWVDANGDGKADYCRVVGGGDKFVQCTLSTGSGFGQTISSSALDPGYDDSRSWVDVNGDGMADYCRFTGSAIYSSTNVRCTTSVGWAFDGGFTTPPMDAGYGGMSGWGDVNGDGKADFCRIVGSYSGMCTLSTGTGLGTSFSHPLSRSGLISWPDVNGDGRADECLRPATDGKVICTLSNGNSFGITWTATA